MSKIFSKADILIPKKGTDMPKWSTVACDQYTSQPDYWESVKNTVGNFPSAYHITLPEIYLNYPDVSERIAKINQNMANYLEKNVFEVLPDSYIYLERKLSDGSIRQGIVGKIDLTRYDFSKTSQSPVRATEGTVIDRLPPRIKVREKALIESPHIMLLIDDIKKTVIEPLEQEKSQFNKIYDFPLMLDSGKITGYLVNEQAADKIDEALQALATEENFVNKYGISEKRPLVFAVGDGNHSLACAKETYMAQKEGLTEEEWLALPSRYALCEIVNLHSPALVFEPIHRIVSCDDPKKLLMDFCITLNATTNKISNKAQEITYHINGVSKKLYINNPSSSLAVGTLQNYIDNYAKTKDCVIDYIHGDDVIMELSKDPKNIGFSFNAINKNELFLSVIKDGALPRKTFSMGNACDKRFYLECRKIK